MWQFMCSKCLLLSITIHPTLLSSKVQNGKLFDRLDSDIP